MGFPELGYVDLEEIAAVKGRLGLPVECDLYFDATHRLIVYARAASHYSAIIESESILEQFV